MRRALCKWFETPLGRSLHAVESHHLRSVLPNLYGTVGVQLGCVGKLDMMDACVAPTRILLELTARADGTTVRGHPEALPFDTKSVDVVVMPHTLDFSNDPHQVLREVNRILSPEGHVVILGFNPASLWGLRKLFTWRRRSMPWCGHFFMLARVKDWLRLLDFELTHGSMFFYRPPIQRETVMDRLYFMDKVGDRWWPMMAGCYLVVAKKRVPGVTPLPLKWKAKRAVGSTATEPATRISVKGAWGGRPRHYG